MTKEKLEKEIEKIKEHINQLRLNEKFIEDTVEYLINDNLELYISYYCPSCMGEKYFGYVYLGDISYKEFLEEKNINYCFDRYREEICEEDELCSCKE